MTSSNFESQRIKILGRLVAGIVHEISNPIQAIGGGLSLAVEEVSDPQAVLEYLGICQQEIDRVSKLLLLIRQIYRPDIAYQRVLDVNKTVSLALALAQDEINFMHLNTKELLADEVLQIQAVESQITLIWLLILMVFIDAHQTAQEELEGGDIQVITKSDTGNCMVEFSTWLPFVIEPATGENPSSAGFNAGLLNVAELAKFNHGTFSISHNGNTLKVGLSFPLFVP